MRSCNPALEFASRCDSAVSAPIGLFVAQPLSGSSRSACWSQTNTQTQVRLTCVDNLVRGLSELLRKSAEHTLMDMVQLLFSRLPQFKEDAKWAASIKKVRNQECTSDFLCWASCTGSKKLTTQGPVVIVQAREKVFSEVYSLAHCS